MNYKRLTLLILVLIAVMDLQAQDEKQTVTGLSESYRLFAMKKDTASLVQLLHPNVSFYPSLGPRFKGKELVNKVISSYLAKNTITEWKINIEEIRKDGNMIFEFGTFDILENDSLAAEQKYLNIWSKDEDKYKLYFRTWSPMN